jgi:ribonuclease VapC
VVIDTSAVLAILLDEPERRVFNERIQQAESLAMSAASFVEIAIVIEARFGAEGQRDFELFMAKAEIRIAEVDAEQARLAFHAWRKFGKGRHTAGLNYGDCFSYALAASRNEPLLFKGSDFSHTDIRAATGR